MKQLRNASILLAALVGVIHANAQVSVFQADFQASTVAAYTDADNLDSGTAIGSWSFQMDTNINVFGNAGASQKALCPDSNDNGGYGLTAFFTSSVKLQSNVVVTIKLARGRNGGGGMGKTFTMTGYDTLGNPNFDLQVFANQNQAAGTNGALYWNNGSNYTNNFGTTYSLAGDVRQINVSSTGYDPANMTALRVQLQGGGYVVSLDKDNNGSFEWTSSLLPYNGSGM
jgi:hypothetical protein